MGNSAVVVFDFDRTIIDGDSDNWVVTQMGLTHFFNQLVSSMPWNSLNRTSEFLFNTIQFGSNSGASVEKGGEKTFIYIGDGGGDYCPSLKLRNGDHVMPRKHYPLSKRILSIPSLVQAQVHEWNYAEELHKTLVCLISKELTVHRYDSEKSQLGCSDSDLDLDST